MIVTDTIMRKLEQDGALVLVTVAAVKGSAPREAGAQMIVFRDGSITGTVGGGTLEWIALAEAQKLFDREESMHNLSKALGPDLGQCCGGHVTLSLKKFTRQEQVQLVNQLIERAATPLYLFGAGHVGKALVYALAALPFRVIWIDPRDNAFPFHLPSNVETRKSINPADQLAAAPSGAFIAVMTHSHALDLSIVMRALPDQRFPFVGLIGSDTKRARFASQLQQAGLTSQHVGRLICPIGNKNLIDKDPAIIAAGIAMQLLIERQNLALVTQADTLGKRQDAKQ